MVSNLDDHCYVLYCQLSNGSCFPLTIAVLIGKKCPAYILSRWWYVALAASYGYKYYLCIVRYTQVLINKFPETNKINLAASGLQSLLLEPILYSDVCLIHCYHVAYFNKHIK